MNGRMRTFYVMPIYRPDYFEHGVYHIYNRGVAKLPTFLDEVDYRDFQDILRYLLIGFPTKKDPNLPLLSLPVTYRADPFSNGLFRSLMNLVAYCLMPNHFHLLVQLKLPIGQKELFNGRFGSFQTIPEFMKLLCITYGMKFNRRHLREGSVFQGRYKIKHISTDADVLQVSRYIHINPVIASLVKLPEDWLFSDYHTYIEPFDASSNNVTNIGLVQSYFGGRPERYKDFVSAVITEQESKIIANYIIDEKS